MAIRRESVDQFLIHVDPKVFALWAVYLMNNFVLYCDMFY